MRARSWRRRASSSADSVRAASASCPSRTFSTALSRKTATERTMSPISSPRLRPSMATSRSPLASRVIVSVTRFKRSAQRFDQHQAANDGQQRAGNHGDDRDIGGTLAVLLAGFLGAADEIFQRLARIGDQCRGFGLGGLPARADIDQLRGAGIDLLEATAPACRRDRAAPRSCRPLRRVSSRFRAPHRYRR